MIKIILIIPNIDDVHLPEFSIPPHSLAAGKVKLFEIDSSPAHSTMYHHHGDGSVAFHITLQYSKERNENIEILTHFKDSSFCFTGLLAEEPEQYSTGKRKEK